MYPRIGIYITSNVNSGGSISPLVPFLKKSFQKSWLNIKEDLDLLYEEIISSIEGLFNKNIDVLGVDVGIDTNGRLWIFENNTFPAQNYYFAEDSELRVLYYKWLTENKA
ncbi:Uncharacterised protein [Staphylococcus xylosus]|nr:Uncharacterised protein [Staphylococcus xylosus]